ncbi:hypothetical protein DFQ50_102451 [Pseudocitrobacter faecalis]|uniref:Uncharacterized protein n=1 Tax=Pseudocitrobacter faecalis TaxID=1398493 RepID=A0ABX9G4L8_9ENTR|nr:hypothetical protein DFQ50_102451 [Pseudocitrobacter faecalis]
MDGSFRSSLTQLMPPLLPVGMEQVEKAAKKSRISDE